MTGLFFITVWNGSTVYTETLAYDGSGRLVREHTPSANVSYSYDSRGNVTRADRTSSGGTSSDVYSYSGDRLGSVSRTGHGTASFTHDSYGRMTFDGLEGVSVMCVFLF